MFTRLVLRVAQLHATLSVATVLMKRNDRDLGHLAAAAVVGIALAAVLYLRRAGLMSAA